MIGGGGFKALLAAGGGKGLYAGVWGNLAGVVPSSALFMSVYEPVKQEVRLVLRVCVWGGCIVCVACVRGGTLWQMGACHSICTRTT
jgi:hypothetical protein